MADAANLDAPNAADLNTAAIHECIAKGWAMKDGSYPIRDQAHHGVDDLKRAIRAVGRGKGSHDAIRMHIINRAKALGQSSLIPKNWNSDGTKRSLDMADTERRFTPGVVELRGTDQMKKIAGYAAVFDKLSRNLGGFVERVDQSAFNDSRSANWPNVVARYNHDPNFVLGTTGGRTLDLRIDPDTGLWYEVTPPQSRADVYELVQRGDVRHSSFAFRVMDDDWTTTDQGYPLRILRSVDLVDVAPVLDPAYPDATSGLRSLATKFDADLDEVVSMAANNELKRFFERTDGTQSTGKPKPPPMRGQAAAALLLANRYGPGE